MCTCEEDLLQQLAHAHVGRCLHTHLLQELGPAGLSLSGLRAGKGATRTRTPAAQADSS